MIKIIRHFEEKLTVDELMKTIQGELRALNIDPRDILINFRNYPKDAIDGKYNIPSEVLQSGLNTITIDTCSKLVTVYTLDKIDDIFVKYRVLSNTERCILLSAGENIQGLTYIDENRVNIITMTTDGRLTIGNNTQETSIQSAGERPLINGHLQIAAIADVEDAIDRLREELQKEAIDEELTEENVKEALQKIETLEENYNTLVQNNEALQEHLQAEFTKVQNLQKELTAEKEKITQLQSTVTSLEERIAALELPRTLEE